MNSTLAERELTAAPAVPVASHLMWAPGTQHTRPGIAIEPVTAADAERAVAVVTLAFSADPAARWMYPDAEQYLTYWPEFVRVFGGKALELGTAYQAEGFAGAALWLPPGERADDDALDDLLQLSVAKRDQDVVYAVFGQMAYYHPHEPHWYLPLIGVDPARMGQGYGSALLAHALRRCDQEGLPAYLESTSGKSKALYERHGFEAVATVQLGETPPIWPMVRKPRVM